MSGVLAVCGFETGDPSATSTVEVLVDSLPGIDVKVASSVPLATERDPGYELIPLADAAAVFRAGMASDAVVLTGEFPFDPAASGPGGKSKLLPVLLALGNLKPTALAAVGFPEVRGRLQVKAARTLLRRSSMTIVSDLASTEQLKSIGAPTPVWVGADLSWLSLSPFEPAERDDSVLIVAGSRGDAPPAIGHLSTALAGHGMNVRVQPWRSGQGGKGSFLSGPDGVEVLDAPASLAEAQDSLSQTGAALVAPSRALATAATAATPTVAFPENRASADLARSLNQPIVGPEETPASVAEALEAALSGVPGPDPAAVERHRGRAEVTLSMLRLVLAGGRIGEPVDDARLLLGPAPHSSEGDALW